MSMSHMKNREWRGPSLTDITPLGTDSGTSSASGVAVYTKNGGWRHPSITDIIPLGTDNGTSSASDFDVYMKNGGWRDPSITEITSLGADTGTSSAIDVAIYKRGGRCGRHQLHWRPWQLCGSRTELVIPQHLIISITRLLGWQRRTQDNRETPNTGLRHASSNHYHY